MWKNIGPDGVLPFNGMQLNPVIGLNTLVNGFDGENTQLLGLDAKYKVTDKAFVYGQFALTDPTKAGTHGRSACSGSTLSGATCTCWRSSTRPPLSPTPSLMHA